MQLEYVSTSYSCNNENENYTLEGNVRNNNSAIMMFSGVIRTKDTTVEEPDYASFRYSDTKGMGDINYFNEDLTDEEKLAIKSFVDNSYAEVKAQLFPSA